MIGRFGTNINVQTLLPMFSTSWSLSRCIDFLKYRNIKNIDVLHSHCVWTCTPTFKMFDFFFRVLTSFWIVLELNGFFKWGGGAKFTRRPIFEKIIFNDIKNSKFLWKKDPSLPAAGIRGQVFRLPVDCSEPLSYGRTENNLFLTKT